MRLLLARHPTNLTAPNPIIVDEMLAFENDVKQEGVSMMIKIRTNGRSSRYLEKLKSSPVWELKSTSRGGEKGGARVYAFLTAEGDAGIVNCEIKEGDSPDIEKLRTVLQVIEAFKRGVPVFHQAKP
jgi:hypothetical protein